MKQYRITSEHFVTPGETGEPDAHLHDLVELKRLAGVGSLGLLEDYNPDGSSVMSAADQDTPSPIGSNDSVTGTEKRQIEKDKHIKVGTPEWFQLWFSKPYLTGEKPIGDSPASKVQRNKTDN